ncbi:acetolactate synthase small subunit [Ostreibacterium oceani]|uniref:Acetolactate synthase small subunit n=1 Tax=Ostreibacterium oceani TaxID=2654998 RepID=A0A6N7EV47_9GAMM|nr:acetolactate synthase small subunit [Ostreibacterium oceani]MPV85485.1 acetolactate synthase small subunit [Ostreibacterium oceani]
MRHIISILIENEAGALSRVVGLFSARDFNIESLTVAPTEDESLSRITLVSSGSDKIIEQIVKQLNKLIDVVKLIDLNDVDHVERELMLVKLAVTGSNRSEIIQIADVFRCRILDVSSRTMTIEATGKSKKLDALLNVLEHEKILEVARTGVCGLARGNNTLHV